jgi:hypothetical protein
MTLGTSRRDIMYGQAQSSVVDNALDEIRNVYPDVSHIFIFNQDGTIVAFNGDTSQELTQKVINAFQTFCEKASVVGGLDSLTITGTDHQMRFNRIDNYVLADVSSPDIDEKSLNALSRVLIPTIIRLSNKSQTNSNGSDGFPVDAKLEQTVPPEQLIEQDLVLPEIHKEKPTPIQNEPSKLFFPEPPANQLMVEDVHGFGKGFGNFKGLRTNPDVALIDRSLIDQWNELCGEKKIEEVIVEDTTNGKRARLRFKPIQDSKYEGKGVVQLSNKTQTELQTKKGTLILVRPIIDEHAQKVQSIAHINEPDEAIAEPEESLNPSQYLPDLEKAEYTVENLSGITVFRKDPPPFIVRIDVALIELWREKYGKNEISMVVVENPSQNQELTCNFKPLQDSNYMGKQIIQLSQKAQAALGVKKGDRVTIKPATK